MRRDNIVIFDEYVASHSPAIVAFSAAALNARLAKFDQLAVMALVDNLNNNTDGFDIWLAQSADNRNWLYRNDSLSRTLPSALPGDITWPAGGGTSGLQLTSTNIGTFLFHGGPLLDFVRFEMAFSSTNTGGHVRIYVTQRDQGA